MSVEEAIAAAQSFSAQLDARFDAERMAIQARAADAKEKLASGLLDIRERAAPAQMPEPSASSAVFEAPATEGADFDPFAFDQNGAAHPVAAPRGVSFDDFVSAPEPNLDMPPGEDDLILDDDGIPTWQEP